MICASWMNYRNEQMYECQQDCQKKLVKEQTEEGSKSKENPKAIGNLTNVKETAKDTTGKDIAGKESIGKDPTTKDHTVKDTAKDSTTPNQLEQPHVPHIAFTSQTKSQTDDQRYSVSGEQHHRIWNSSNRSSFSNISIKYQDNLNFVYSYIDIERLILDNLKARIRELGEHGTVGYDELFASNNDLDEAAFDRKIERKRDSKIELDKNVDEKKNDKQDKTDQANIHVDQETSVRAANQFFGKLNERSDHDRNVSAVDLHSNNPAIDSKSDPKSDPKNGSKIEPKIESKSLDKSEVNSGVKSERSEVERNEKEQSERNDKNVQNAKNSQMHSLTKELKKHSKRKKSARNTHWAEFLTACEEDFEFNQSKINTNYNSRKLKDCMFVYANCVTNNWVCTSPGQAHISHQMTFPESILLNLDLFFFRCSV